jgi:signal transduction histidine kinase
MEAPWLREGHFFTVKDVISRLLRPLRSASTWRTLVHVTLDLPMGLAAFIPTVILLSLATSLLCTFPLALPFIYLTFFSTKLFARLERHRFAALHRIELADPIPPLRPGSIWDRLGQRVRSAPRWKVIFYCLLLMPVGIAFFGLLATAWCGSLAMLLLPAYVSALPADTAQFGLFGVSQGPSAFVTALVGLFGLVVVAPWLTVGIGWLDVRFSRWFLGPDVGAELVEQVTRAESGRVAAVDSAESERRRIERDLHDGAQQRLVALAVDLGVARQRLETDPESGKQMVAEAHEEAKAALKEIRDLVRGIHPVILEDRGLDAALSAVVARSPIPVELDVDIAQRPPASVESAAYFVVSEALTNVARHANATRAKVAVVRSGDRLIVEIRDDGVGGADPSSGTGLQGLAERVTGMGATMDLLSPIGGPTTLLVEFPCAS